MWFNIAMNNHGPIEAYETLCPLIDYFRGTLSKCGHDVTVGHDKLYPDAINLYFENFSDEAMASKVLDFKYANSLKIGVIATELMVGGTIPYARHGMLYTGNVDKAQIIRNRMAGFRKIAQGVDFLWCLLERTALEYTASNPLCEFFPVGHVRQVEPGLRRSPKDIDVVFFGARTPHRMAVLNSLAAVGVGVMAVGRGFPIGWLPSSLLLSLLDRAKIGLNLTLHAKDDGRLDIDPRFVSCMRVTEMLERDLCIVSEDIPFDNPYRAYMSSAPAEEVAAMCRDLLVSGRWEEIGPVASAAFRSGMDVSNLCSPIIQRTIDSLWQPDRT